ncbi:U4/U6 small nuclear ribonucleoprotein prp4 [Xanthoria parietina]
MTSRSTSSTPSEGEIVETDSDKATTSLHTVKDKHVNPQSRLRVSVSPSPSPIRSPKSHRSRTRSRSPYREPRGSKRSREGDHCDDRPREDTRRFKVKYEDRPYADRRKPHRLTDLDRSRGPDPSLSYDDRHARFPDRKHRVRSRSPYYKSLAPHHARHREIGRDARRDGHGWQDQDRRRHDKEGRNMLSREQSVSDRGHSPVATASYKQKAETKPEQKHHNEMPHLTQDSVTAKLPHDGDAVPEADQPQPARPVLDEAALIEERRKRREAIKAKHRGQGTPLSVEALALASQSAANSPKPSADAEQHLIPSQLGQNEHRASPHHNLSTNDGRSAPSTPKEAAGQDSPPGLVVLDDKDLANQTATSNGFDHEDEPSAADYDPTMDMQEDRARQDNRQIEEVPSEAYDETTAARPDVLLPQSSVQGLVDDKVEDPNDMFADEDDMFAEAPVVAKAPDVTSKAVAVPQTKTLDMSMLDDWDDDEGYYKVHSW